MDLGEQLRVLEAAKGDPAKLALAAIDITFPTLPDHERSTLKDALSAAAIPHWFGEDTLAVLLDITPEESRTHHVRLRQLNLVEPFPARGRTAVNVHEAARLALRKALAEDQADRFRALSGRIGAHFASDPSPAGRIEWIYHRLCTAPDEAAGDLEWLSRSWSNAAWPEDRQALAIALHELISTGLVGGRALLWASLRVAWTRVERGETAQIGDAALEALQLARELCDARAESSAQCLLGDVRQAQGQLDAALAAFAECLAISRRLADEDPSILDWQRTLVVAHSRVGDVLLVQGQLDAAQAAFAENLAIGRRLAEQDPSNAGWQRELAVAHCKVGDVLKAKGELDAAQAAFAEYLAISLRLAEQDPGNAGWQRNLAVAHSRTGNVLQAKGQLDAAQAGFAECLAISHRLAEHDPSNAGWQRDLAATHSRLGEVQQAKGQFDAAQVAFAECVAISRRLAEQDPSNADWQRDLAVAQSRLGEVRRRNAT